MGTNYYLQIGICECCKRPARELHIGKSSYGWCFSLHVAPEEGINDLADWEALWSKSDTRIRDEYSAEISVSEMMETIADRPPFHRNVPHTAQFYATNSAEPGPRNLLRHRIDGRHCIGHGDGTYDLITGEFS